MDFWGTTAYIVNANSKSKILEHLLWHKKEINTPIDLLYSFLIRNDLIKAYFTLPFLTTISDHAFNSVNQTTDSAKYRGILDSFRPLLSSGAFESAYADPALFKDEKIEKDADMARIIHEMLRNDMTLRWNPRLRGLGSSATTL